jgi:hypothetical protein
MGVVVVDKVDEAENPHRNKSARRELNCWKGVPVSRD